MVKELLTGDTDPLQRAFASVIGLPAWFVRKGYGSFLTLEFGTPHLRIREPIVASPGAGARIRAVLQRRKVTPHGDWHLWIYVCHWRVLSNGAQVAWSEASDEEICAAAREIDGQLLTNVEVDPTQGTSAFRFDQGASVQTWPYDDGNGDEQWMLYMKSGDFFTYRGDGCFSLGPGSETLDAKTWQPLRPTDPSA